MRPGCALLHHACLLARIRLTRTAAERGPVRFGERGQVGVFRNPLRSSAFPCSSSRSEHGILGKRRVKLRSPAVGRTPRGCQPDEQFRPRLSGTLWSAAVRVRGFRAQRRGRGTAQLASTARNGGGGQRLNSLKPRATEEPSDRHLLTSQPPPRRWQSRLRLLRPFGPLQSGG